MLGFTKRWMVPGCRWDKTWMDKRHQGIDQDIVWGSVLMVHKLFY